MLSIPGGLALLQHCHAPFMLNPTFLTTNGSASNNLSNKPCEKKRTSFRKPLCSAGEPKRSCLRRGSSGNGLICCHLCEPYVLLATAYWDLILMTLATCTFRILSSTRGRMAFVMLSCAASLSTTSTALH